MCLSVCPFVYANREYAGTTAVKDGLAYINQHSIPAAQLPNQFIYIPVEILRDYGFDVSVNQAKDIYTVHRNEERPIGPSAVTAADYTDTTVYTTDVKVYIDSELPANVFELEDGTVLVQSDELAKYGEYHWNDEAHTISIQLTDKRLLPETQKFQQILGIDSIDDIAYGTIVLGKNRCADIQPEDLKTWLNTFWNFSYDRVVAPMLDIGDSDYYIKLWNQDKTKSYTVYLQDIIAGNFGESYEANGTVKKNYVWYKPYIGNARNALYTASNTLYTKYLDQSYEEYVGNERAFTPLDENDTPDENNLLLTTGCSEWANAELQKAAASNLMLYELSNQYKQNITRLDFCKLACRLIATEVSPNSDSRTGMWAAIEQLMDERGLRETAASTEFTDCNNWEVSFLAAAEIIYGVGEGAFAPDSPITREQAAAILCRMAQFLGTKTIIPPHEVVYYYDEDEISDWAKSAVKSMREMGVMKGISEYDFSPRGAYTVEQSIATMLRLYECS